MTLSRAGIYLVATMALLFHMVCPFPPGRAEAKIVDRIAAVVNGEVITLSEVEEKARPVLERLEAQGENVGPLERQRVMTKVLGELIDQTLVEIESKKLGIDVSDEEVELAYSQLLADNGVSEEELKRQLASSGLSLQEYKEQLKLQIKQSRLVQSQVRSKIAVTNDEILQYAKEKGLVTDVKEPLYSLQHICIPYGKTFSKEEARKRAEAAYDKLRSGAPFEEVAREFSSVPSAHEGGFLGTFTLKEMAPFVKEAIAGLKEGEFTPVMDTPMGWQIFRLKGVSRAKDGGIPKGLAEEIRQKIYRQKINSQLEQWLGRLRQKYTIKILL